MVMLGYFCIKKVYRNLKYFGKAYCWILRMAVKRRPNLSGNGKISYVDLKGLPDYGLKKKKKHIYWGGGNQLKIDILLARPMRKRQPSGFCKSSEKTYPLKLSGRWF